MNKDILIDVPMPIYTPRLIIRPPKEGDGKAMHAAKLESYDELYKWMIWINECPKADLSAEKDEIFCREAMAKFILRENILLYAFDRQTHEFIGGTGIHDANWKLRLFRTGYWVRSSKTGQGYATEMATAIAHYVFKALRGRKLSISHAEGNKPSQRIIEKIGYQQEGLLKKCHELPDGRIVDEYNYGLFDLAKTPELEVSCGSK